MQLKPIIRSRLNSKQPPITDITINYSLAQTVMVLIDSIVFKKPAETKWNLLLGISEKYFFKGRRLTRLTKRLLVNVAKYFERKAKKTKSRTNIVDKTEKQQVR